MKRILTMSVFLLLVGTAYAQVSADSGTGVNWPAVGVTTTTQPAPPTISNLPTPGITPDSWLYTFKRAWQSIDMTLTFNNADKAQKEINYANERLAEVQYLVSQNKLDQAMQTRSEYDNGVKAAENDLAQADASGTDTTDVRKNIQQQLQRHEDVLNRVIANVNNTNAKAALEQTLQNQEQHRVTQIDKLREIQQKQAEKRAEQINKTDSNANPYPRPTITLPVLPNGTSPPTTILKHEGAKEGQICGGMTGVKCEDNLLCAISATGTSDATGICTRKGGPVPTCGGITGKECPDGMTCQIESKNPDAGGFCLPKPVQITTQTTLPSDNNRVSDVGGICGGSIGYNCKEGLKCNAPTSPPKGKEGMTGWDVGRCTKGNTIEQPINTPQPIVGMANPASVYCRQIGGNITITTDAGGNQGGQCTLPTGAICEEWALYEGNCGGALGRH
jgi:putative hemolysin